MAMAVVYTTFGGQIVHENRGGVERRYLADPLGSTIALTDSGTAITDTWDYWPYGEVMSRTGTNPTPFTFVGTLGYFKDLLDKLFYVRARFYKPNYGRWSTVDPLWPREVAYVYGGTSPQSRVDPGGLQAIDPIELYCGADCRKLGMRTTGHCTDGVSTFTRYDCTRQAGEPVRCVRICASLSREEGPGFVQGDDCKRCRKSGGKTGTCWQSGGSKPVLRTYSKDGCKCKCKFTRFVKAAVICCCCGPKLCP